MAVMGAFIPFRDHLVCLKVTQSDLIVESYASEQCDTIKRNAKCLFLMANNYGPYHATLESTFCVCVCVCVCVCA